MTEAAWISNRLSTSTALVEQNGLVKRYNSEEAKRDIGGDEAFAHDMRKRAISVGDFEKTKACPSWTARLSSTEVEAVSRKNDACPICAAEFCQCSARRGGSVAIIEP